MPNKNNNNYLVIPKAQIFDNPGNAIRGVVLGFCQAGIVRGFMNPTEAENQAQAIVKNCKWRDGLHPELGGVLGPSLFEYMDNPIEYFDNSLLAAAKINAALGKQPTELYEAINSFESLPSFNLGSNQGQPRIRPVVYKGKPAAYNRALVFDCANQTIVKIHEDLSNVRALASHNFEIAQTQIVLAHNLYLRNKKGEGSLFMYGKKFTDAEKIALDKKISKATGKPSLIATTGYPYPQSEFQNCPPTQIDVEAGDYVVFRADFPHKVETTCEPTPGYRVSWNGFFTLLYGRKNELVYWT
jgi:hypothetical protein